MTDSRAMVPAAGGAPPALTSSDMLRGLHTVRSVLAPDLSDDELKLFAMVATRSGLDPFAKQLYAVKRKGRVTFQTGIDGYRSIAARTGMYDGQDEPEYGPVCGCGDARPAGHPESATVRVYRKGVGRAIAATAFWHEYVPAAGQSGEGDAMWRRMPRVMIAKVAEALALRKAFPYDPERREGIGADLYTADEMAQAGPVEAPAAQPTARERVAQRAAAIVEPPAEAREPAPEPAADEIVGEFTTEPPPASRTAPPRLPPRETPATSPTGALDEKIREANAAVAVKRAEPVPPAAVPEEPEGLFPAPADDGLVASAMAFAASERTWKEGDKHDPSHKGLTRNARGLFCPTNIDGTWCRWSERSA